jgi:hypothetical protein
MGSGALAYVKTMKLLRIMDHMLKTGARWRWED